jgi:hypothetical protein
MTKLANDRHDRQPKIRQVAKVVDFFKELCSEFSQICRWRFEGYVHSREPGVEDKATIHQKSFCKN